MKLIEDEAQWIEAYLDTPIGVPQDRVAAAHAACDPNKLIDVPGVCVKSKARDAKPPSFPKHHGKLVKYDPEARHVEQVVVRGHGTPVSPKVVWVGSIASYEDMWEVD
jgi:hypothetical protein